MKSSGSSTVQARYTFRRSATKAGAPSVLATSAGVVLTCTALGLVATVPAASASVTTFYAYANGRAVMPSSCPETGVASKQCTLGEALTLVAAGGTVALASPGGTAPYVGNWAVSTPRTSSSSPVSIEAAPGVIGPILDGNHGSAKGCHTTDCNGPILAVRSDVHLRIDGLTLENADNTTSNYGGAIENDGGGVVSVLASTFSGNSATDGGAVDNGDDHGTGTLTVSGSTFSGNSARGKSPSGDGGAIDNGDHGGTGTVSVSGSTFSGNSAPGNNTGPSDGGAIDNGDRGGTGALAVSGSAFLRNSATAGGGAIDNGDRGGTSTFTVSASVFSSNSGSYGGALADGTAHGSVSGSAFSENVAGYGGAILNGESLAILAVAGSTFSQNRATGNGGAIDNGDGLDLRGTLSVSSSTFWENSATGGKNSPTLNPKLHNGDGGAIDNGDNEGTGNLTVSGSTFSGNTAKTGGGAINNFLTVWATANIFSGPCHEAVGGLWNDQGYNVATSATCLSGGTGDVAHGADRLGPLAHNGGHTETMLPLAGNPALGVIPYGTTEVLSGRTFKLCPTTDQRGVASAAGRHCNAGAVQSGAVQPGAATP